MNGYILNLDYVNNWAYPQCVQVPGTSSNTHLLSLIKDIPNEVHLTIEDKALYSLNYNYSETSDLKDIPNEGHLSIKDTCCHSNTSSISLYVQ